MLRALVLGFCAASFVLNAASADKVIVGGIVGKWTLVPDKSAIHFGQTLQPQQEVVCEGRGSLSLLPGEFEPPLTLRCEVAGQQTSVAVFLAKNESHPVVEGAKRLWAMIQLEFSKEPAAYITAVSRGFGNAEVSEAVLRLQGNRVDLGPALKDAPAGDYGIAFMATEDKTPDGPSVPVHWQPGSAALVEARSAFRKPGVVKIAIADSDGTLSSTAWVFIVAPDTFAKYDQRFGEAQSMVHDWPGGEHAQVSRSVLRACLKGLQDQGVQ